MITEKIDPTCKWCGRARGILPLGVLLCSHCDYDHSRATVIPNEHQVKDVNPES